MSGETFEHICEILITIMVIAFVYVVVESAHNQITLETTYETIKRNECDPKYLTETAKVFQINGCLFCEYKNKTYILRNVN